MPAVGNTITGSMPRGGATRDEVGERVACATQEAGQKLPVAACRTVREQTLGALSSRCKAYGRSWPSTTSLISRRALIRVR